MKLKKPLFKRQLRYLTLLLGLLLFLPAAPLQAAGEEETIALNFLKYLRSDKAILSSESKSINLLDPQLPPVLVAHLFNLEGGGYLLVATDRSISPVKAYSLTGDFSALPTAYQKALLAELELRVRVAAALRETAGTRTAAGVTETEAQWNFLLNLDTVRLPQAIPSVVPLLDTTWAQGYPYNKFLPAIGDQTVLAGCTNVAVAQIMSYYRYPASGQGTASFLWDGTQPPEFLKTTLYRTFNWENMPVALDAQTPEYQADEVALLLRDLGIAHHTDFDFEGSSTYLQPNVMIENFGYSTSLSKMTNGDYNNFIDELQGNIANSQPVLLTFPGHMAVADGYSTDNTGTKIHVNMGWGGTANDFYFLNAPVEAGNYTFPTTAGALSIYINIKPCSSASGDCAPASETADSVNGLAIAGRFDRNWDADQYQVYLKGSTTVSAQRGYGNVAFYISVVNEADGNEVFAIPDPSTAPANTALNVGSNLPPGKYRITASLCSGNGASCFAPGAGQYTLAFTSGSLTAAEKASADEMVDKPPVIAGALPDLLLNVSAPARKVLIDARDENGDQVIMQVGNSNPAAVSAVLNGNILELLPTGVPKVSSKITIRATAGGKSAEKSFTVMTDDVDVAFGTSFTVGGTFGSQEDLTSHSMILDGSCSISGFNGYSNQAFYTSVLDSSGQVIIAENDTTINYSFNRGLYAIQASLEQKSGGYYYEYKQGVNDNYTLTVSCPQADVSTATLARLLGIDLAGTAPRGDVNGDGQVALDDVILMLQLLSGMDMTGQTVLSGADVDGDGTLGLAEAVFLLQETAGLRLP